MRGTVAKSIRRIARRATVGHPAVAYDYRKVRKQVGVRTSATGLPIAVTVVIPVARLRRGCTRQLTKLLKRQYPKAKRGELK